MPFLGPRALNQSLSFVSEAHAPGPGHELGAQECVRGRAVTCSGIPSLPVAPAGLERAVPASGKTADSSPVTGVENLKAGRTVLLTEERLGRSVWGYWERKFPRIQLLGADRAGVDALPLLSHWEPVCPHPA